MENKENNINIETNNAPVSSNDNILLRKRNRILILVGLILILSTGLLFFSSKSSSYTPQLSNVSTHLKDDSVTPTPIPFIELTVPFLREKTYESKLSELQPISAGSNYNAYLTSYTSDGLKVNGLLTKPEGEVPEGGFPAIVFTHGYLPPASYQTNGEPYSSYVDYLARSGFVVFKIDLRGHGNSEGEAGGGYYGSDYVSDILHAYNALQNSDFVNPSKIGLWGHSMSGNAVLRSMAVRPEIPASVIWAGAVYTYVDMQKYRINDSSYQPPQNNTERQARRRELFEKHGSPSAASVFWKQVAPTNYLADLKGAISIHHAVDDSVVNIGYSRDLNSLLDQTSIVHELYEYPFGGHNITGTSFSLAMQRTVEFFKENL